MLLRAWLPFLSMLLQLAVALGGAQWIDTSSRFPENRGFGYAFGIFIAAFLYASWPTVITFLLAVSASFARDRRRTLARWSASIAALWGVVVGGFGVASLVDAVDSADRAFGVVLLVAGLCSVVPLLFAFGRTERTAPEHA